MSFETALILLIFISLFLVFNLVMLVHALLDTPVKDIDRLLRRNRY